MKKTPKSSFQACLDQDKIQYDTLQAQVVDHLQHVFDELTREPSLLQRTGLQSRSMVKGLYVWGGVGAGKTFLMDLFYDALPFSEKRRVHFHVFMREVHEALTDAQGHKNPLELIAKRIAKQVRVLCFDEFHVNDIADAMLLAGLLKTLFAQGVCLVATSNLPPNGLYPHGLQRQQFLPAIALLEQNTKVVHLYNEIDYRLQYLNDAGVYHSPLNEQTTAMMRESFEQLAGIHARDENRVRVAGRDIPVRGLSHDVVWFDFSAIFGIPRCQRDYIDIANRFSTVMVSGLPVLKADQRNLTRSLINLVDVFYDAKVKLIISAQAPIQEIYPTGTLAFEFERCISRLIEMRSDEYLNAG